MERFEKHQLKLSKNAEKKRKRKRFPNVFFKKEITLVFDAIEDAKTMIASFLTFFCALRISEVCKLKWQDIDLENRMLKVVDGKGGKDGFITISPVCIPILKKWRVMTPNSEYFLPPESNEPTPFLTRRSLLFRFRKALKKAGLDIPTDKNARGLQQHQYKFHTLRHSRCTHLINNGVQMFKVQQFMRHNKIETTMNYTWITDPELQNMVEEVDSAEKENNILNETVPISIENYNDPIEIAKRRLACGEISRREFRSIVFALQTPMSV